MLRANEFDPGQYSVAPLLPEKLVVVRSQVSGVVDAYNFENGDPVKKGNPLLAISARDYTLNLNLARYELDVSKSELATQQKQLARFQSLYKTKGISASDLDNQTRLTNISQAQRNASNVRYDIARETLNKSAPKAPFSGVIVKRTVELGQFISVGDPLYTIVDTQQLKARFHLLEADFTRLKKGDQLKVVVPSIGQSLTGHVTVLSPAIQADAPGFLVEVTVNNRAGKLSAGMESRVYLDVTGRTIAGEAR
ncbi:efflux RND transporter periplasmic adaptor subunit [Endozoicomonas sp. GU-1]|uniref:efflux RND transporter periplasmic adaptor subunit n=1 Tax=Endozoicomonas sp. GU-1 TaxID=3009078 RepID=UPI0022B43142|nr:efflux RND transporter periplasmic adaptor subunit [Endozoicomonas sp. GU-1]WBA80245.1 efflux RND transporter periplasmic adaptor subunit [Endozoicomonas sp. GU-1]